MQDRQDTRRGEQRDGDNDDSRGVGGQNVQAYGGSGRSQTYDAEFDPAYLDWRETQLAGHDRDYQQWREARSREHDDEYRRWRGERNAPFHEDFHAWRSSRPPVGDEEESKGLD